MRSVEDKIQDIEDQKQRINETIAFGCGHTEREETLTMGRTRPSAWMRPRMCDKCAKPLIELYDLCERELKQLQEQQESKYAALNTHARLFHKHLHGNDGTKCCALEESIKTALSEYANVKLEGAAKMLETYLDSPIMADAVRALKDKVKK